MIEQSVGFEMYLNLCRTNVSQAGEQKIFNLMMMIPNDFLNRYAMNQRQVIQGSVRQKRGRQMPVKGPALQN
jgi:hypothetical protein